MDPTLFKPWNEKKTKWNEMLMLQAVTYKTFDLFDVVANTLGRPNPNRVKYGEFEDSPSGKWRYGNNVIPLRSYHKPPLGTHYDKVWLWGSASIGEDPRRGAYSCLLR